MKASRRMKAGGRRIRLASEAVAPAFPSAPPKPRLYLDGKHAKGIVERAKVGQKVTAVLTGRVTSLEKRQQEAVPGVRRRGMAHSACLEMDSVKMHGGEE